MNDPTRPKLGTLVLRIGSAVAATTIWSFYTVFASAFSNLGAALGLPLFVIGGILIFGLAHATRSARRSGVSAAVASVGVLGLAFAAASGLRLPLYFATDDFELDSETAITLLLAVAAAVPTFGWPSAGSDAERRRARRVTLVFLAAFAVSCAVYGYQTRERPLPPIYQQVLEGDEPQSILRAIADGAAVDERVRATGEVRSAYLGQTALHAAARQRDAGLIAALLEAGADPTVTDKLSRTPLHAALEKRDSSGRADPVVRQLLEAGADPNARDRFGRTPLHDVAARSDDPDLLAALIAAGAEIESLSDPPEWGTPLLFAVEYGDPAVMEVLLAAGANTNDVNYFGQSALTVLLERCRPDGFAGSAEEARISMDKLRRLLEGGSDPLAPDPSGKVPLELARDACSPEILAVLRQAAGESR